LLIPFCGFSQELIGVLVGLEFELEDEFHTLMIPDKRLFFNLKIGVIHRCLDGHTQVFRRFFLRDKPQKEVA
jgi:histidinol phosphatase-like PHP family hydrolase